MKGKIVEDILREHVADNKCVFVFPTQTACELWADKAISIGSTKAVATQRFIAWDEFKSTSVRGVTQDKGAIPATLRKIFVHMLIERNAKEHFFSNLIPTEYADSASNFAAWISSLLPSLAQWKKRSEKSTLEKDEEDKDLDKLYSLYKEFLDQRKLFEPAWEMPPLRDDGNKYFIFFPEILMDWSEYKEILESGSNIEIIEVPKIEEEEKPICHFFANSREELRNMAIYLRKIHQEKNIPWNKIAISVPDMETYEPYIERELSLYMIPCVLRNGKPLTQSGAGNFFLQAAECAQSNFSFESLKTLLLNNELPWKEKDLNEQLIVFGQENNCLCSYEYKGKKTDVWEEAFKMSGKEERLFNFYKKLKQDLTNLSNATSFKNIRTQYFILRNDFFDMSVCPVFSDFIMSRCISELSSLI
ncbi:MAG: PD-(D/E)XK nuclease family protein, partial [Treponema sp.]|nr:PD-(D/E)XK nuclease family protein [Treponema sp.]